MGTCQKEREKQKCRMNSHLLGWLRSTTSPLFRASFIFTLERKASLFPLTPTKNTKNRFPKSVKAYSKSHTRMNQYPWLYRFSVGISTTTASSTENFILSGSDTDCFKLFYSSKSQTHNITPSKFSVPLALGSSHWKGTESQWIKDANLFQISNNTTKKVLTQHKKTKIQTQTSWQVYLAHIKKMASTSCI